MALRQMFHGHIDAEHDGCKSHGGIKHGDVFLTNALTGQGTNGATNDNGHGVQNDCIHRD